MLWWAIVGAGLYHGLNPGMGWPLAVSAALMERRGSALPRAVLALAAGHLLAMLAVLLPFSALAGLAAHAREIQAGAGTVVVLAGLYLLITNRHPRFLARVPPSRLALWSFLAATAHGAGLMLVPLMFGIDTGHDMAGMAGMGSMSSLGSLGSDLLTAAEVALLHTATMALVGAAVAVGVYRWLGLRFLTRAWFDLDRVWAVSLVLVGSFGIWSALT